MVIFIFSIYIISNFLGKINCDIFYSRLAWREQPRWDSNPQSPPSEGYTVLETGVLTIRRRGAVQAEAQGLEP